MKDYMKEMLHTWSTEGEQAAYDLGLKLLGEIEAEQERLVNQASAINALGKYLQDTANVVARSTNTNPELDIIEPAERPRLIVEAATEIWQNQKDSWLGADAEFVKVQAVLERLKEQGLDLGVQQPLAVIGTVLASADGFKKVARNTFEYAPQPQTDAVDDLPW